MVLYGVVSAEYRSQIHNRELWWSRAWTVNIIIIRQSLLRLAAGWLQIVLSLGTYYSLNTEASFVLQIRSAMSLSWRQLVRDAVVVVACTRVLSRQETTRDVWNALRVPITIRAVRVKMPSLARTTSSGLCRAFIPLEARMTSRTW